MSLVWMNPLWDCAPCRPLGRPATWQFALAVLVSFVLGGRGGATTPTVETRSPRHPRLQSSISPR